MILHETELLNGGEKGGSLVLHEAEQLSGEQGGTLLLHEAEQWNGGEYCIKLIKEYKVER